MVLASAAAVNLMFAALAVGGVRRKVVSALAERGNGTSCYKPRSACRSVLEGHKKTERPDENPTIGLLLCKSAKKTVVELPLPKDANIHAKEYQFYLPSKELLKQKLDEWSAAASR